MKKYEFTDETKKIHNVILRRNGAVINIGDVILHRIKAVKTFGDVKRGSLGGFIEKEDNLSHEGNAWVYGNACVYGDACVGGNACIFWDAEVSDNALIYGDAQVYGNAMIFDNVQIFDVAQVAGNTQVAGNAEIYGGARILGLAKICKNAQISNDTNYMTIGLIGSRRDTTTFFKNANNKIFVSCGCFLGSLEKFRKEVKKVHGVNIKYAKMYQAAADLAEIQILCKECKEAEE